MAKPSRLSKKPDTNSKVYILSANKSKTTKNNYAYQIDTNNNFGIFGIVYLPKNSLEEIGMKQPKAIKLKVKI